MSDTDAPDDALDKRVTSEPIEDEEGRLRRLQRQNTSPREDVGGGEFPDPHTPPRESAPGTVGPDRRR